MGLIRFIIIVFFIYLFFRIFSRIILPVLVKFSVNRFQKRFYEQNPHLRPEPPREEGEITIEHIPEEKTRTNSSYSGEYVDYEEIK